MSGQGTSPAPKRNEEAIRTALSAVKKLSVANGQPLRKRVEALVEESADHEVGALLYDIARATLAENEVMAVETGWYYEVGDPVALQRSVEVVDARSGGALAPTSLAGSENALIEASRLLDLAEERLGEQSAISSGRSSIEATRGNTELAIRHAQRALATATRAEHREAGHRNLVRALLRAGDAEESLAAARDAARECGESRLHLYHLLSAHAVGGDFDSFRAIASKLCATPSRSDGSEPASWADIVKAHGKWFASNLNASETDVLAAFDLEALS